MTRKTSPIRTGQHPVGRLLSRTVSGSGHASLSEGGEQDAAGGSAPIQGPDQLGMKPCGSSQPPESRPRLRETERGLGRPHHLRPDLPRPTPSGQAHGALLAPGRRPSASGVTDPEVALRALDRTLGARQPPATCPASGTGRSVHRSVFQASQQGWGSATSMSRFQCGWPLCRCAAGKSVFNAPKRVSCEMQSLPRDDRASGDSRLHQRLRHRGTAALGVRASGLGPLQTHAV